MKVLYDHQAFTMQHFGGVSKCFCELLLHRPVDMDIDIAIKQTNNTHLIDSKLVEGLIHPAMDFQLFAKRFPFIAKHKIYQLLNTLSLIKGSEFLNKEESIRKIKDNKYDVFHATFFDDYFLPYIGNKPFVITVHDMMPEIFPDYFRKPNPETKRKKELCEKAAAVIAVSENTKKDLIRIMDIPEEKIHVVYHGGPKVTEKFSLPLIDGEYFLYVGQRDAYKNFHQTLVDFSLFHQRFPQVKLVCTGKPFTLFENKMITDLGLEKVVVFFRPSDLELLNLYHYAIAFIYPSLYEGFGMPILEAFSCGCPVLLNKKSCFPEIAGPAAIYFESIEGKSNLFQQMIDIYNLSSLEKNELIEKGLSRAGMFNWAKSSMQLMGIYESCIK